MYFTWENFQVTHLFNKKNLLSYRLKKRDFSLLLPTEMLLMVLEYSPPSEKGTFPYFLPMEMVLIALECPPPQKAWILSTLQ